MISFLFLTLNEESNMPRCLDAVSWSNDIVVLDSLSTDRTCEIAEQKGARIVKRKFTNWADHQNWAMKNIQFKNKWVFYLDADEVMTTELKEEILSIADSADQKAVAYYCGRKNFFMGRWIKHCFPPVPLMRFFIPKHVKFERLVNPTAVVDGQHGILKNYFLHYSFSKGIGEWIEKHNRYSAFEAQELLKDLDSGRLDWGGLLALGDPVRRRRALKQLSFRLPFRPSLRFWYMYALRLGVLDGTAGLAYCRLLAMYEYMIDLKVRELRRQREGKPV